MPGRSESGPLWDAGMLVLLLGGLTTSTIGFCFGVKRLRRSVAPAAAARTAPTFADPPEGLPRRRP